MAKKTGFQKWWRENIANTFFVPKTAARLAWIHQQRIIDAMGEDMARETELTNQLTARIVELEGEYKNMASWLDDARKDKAELEQKIEQLEADQFKRVKTAIVRVWEGEPDDREELLHDLKAALAERNQDE